ncbi:MAG TPA: carboxypeptidase regulatory-like domain-containing protein [Gemmatimonadaceae bacterium]|nr:carboxypeptidase regulatory-like domain-containing protein [Gemmatimonadaceae bacterium]
MTLLAAGLVPAALVAQTLRLRVIDSVSAQPVVGALVSTIAASGVAGEPVLTSPEGMAILRVGAAGVYRARVRRIGYTPFTSDELRVAGADDPVVTLTVPSLRVALAAVRVTARRSCDRRVASPSAEASTLWEEVRKALEASQLSRTGMFVSTTAVTFERQFGENGQLEKVDTIARGVAGSRPFSARDPASLERAGYVEGSSRSGWTFYGPDEQALLSDVFTTMHCLRLADSVRKDGPRTLVGLAFDPRTDNRVPDIQGTIWVDSAASELTRVEFAYVRTPLPHDVPGVGGSVDFARTRSGGWIVTSWLLRLPRWRASGLEPSGVRLAGFTEFGGSASVARETRVAEVSARRAISGTVFDSLTGRPLANARVRLPDLKREEKTDWMGDFRFEDVGVGVHRITVAHPDLELPGVIALGEADLVSASNVQVTLALPSFETVWRRTCGGTTAPADGNGGFLFGRVVAATTGVPDTAATVELSWRAPDPAGGASDVSAARQVRTDSAGRFVACVTTGGKITVRATHAAQAMQGTTPVTLRVGAARLVRRDLSLASDRDLDQLAADTAATVERLDPAAGGVIAGVVRDATGRPLKDVRVRVMGVAGEARTDGRGAFAYRGALPGRRVASLEAIGYERARRLVELAAGDSAFLDVRLGRLTTLAAVTVRERERVNALRAEIAQRVRAGFGYLTDSVKLAKMINTWTAFEVPNAVVHWRGPNSWTVVVSRVVLGEGMINCVPAVWLDDQLSEFEQLAMVPKENLALLEFYSRAANVPLKYGGSARLAETANWGAQQSTKGRAGGASPRQQAASTDSTLSRGDCGVVLAWTKAFLGKGGGKP